MLSGATRGGGGRALGAHLADRKGENVRTEMGETRHLGAARIEGALRELDDGAAHGRTRQHAYHLHADPAPGERWTASTWSDWWDRLEQRLDLADQPFVEARHTTWREAPEGADHDQLREIHGTDAVRLRDRDGRAEVLMEHRHRVYSRVREDGSVVPLRHDYAAREAVARQIEHDHGLGLKIGGHNRAVAAAMRREGRHDVAEAMRAAGLVDAPRPVADLTPQDRAQQERTGVPQADVDRRIMDAWRAGDSPQAKAAALRDAGLTPVMGAKGAGVIDEAGGFHLLTKAVGRASKRDGERIGAAEVRVAFDGLDLPHYAAAAGRPRRDAEPAEAPEPVDAERAPAAAGESLAAEAAAPGAADADPGEPVEGAAPEAPAEAPAMPVVEVAPTEAPAPASQPDAPAGGAAPAPAPVKGGPSPSAVGDGGGGADELVRPWDGTDKDWSRFMAAWARAEQAKRAKAGAAEDAARRSSAPTMTEEDHEWIRELAHRIATRFERAPASDRVERAQAAFLAEGTRRTGAARAPMERGADPRGPGGHGRPRPGAGGAPGNPRSQGANARPLGDAADCGHGRGPARPVGVVGPARGQGGAVADRAAPGLGADDGGRDRTDRAAAGRARIADRFRQRALAGAVSARADQLAALKAALSAPPTPGRMAREALHADRQRIQAVLATAPYPDPRSRSTDHVASDLRDQVHERQTQAEREAGQAEHRADTARRALRLRDRILPTGRARAAREAGAEAERLRLDADTGRGAIREDLYAADQRAPHVAQARRREHDAWERRSDVMDARRREEADRLIEDRLRRGDCELLHRVAGGDLDGAQRQVLEDERRRQDELRRQREEQLRREHEERMRGYEASRGPSPGGRSPAPSPGPRR